MICWPAKYGNVFKPCLPVIKEPLFLKRNADKWKGYEEVLSGAGDPDRLAAAFIELTDDLAYARTFYPGSRTVSYLNGLASGFHHRLYSNKKESVSRVWSFWQYELPLLFRRYHRYLLYAFVFFGVFAAIGALSAARDPSFVRLVLGDHYVNTTLDNIRRGDPFGIYGSAGPVMMFLQIAFNNIKVAFLAYVMGISGGVFTVFFLMANGVMIGAFETFFFRHGLGWHSVLAVFIHGTIELSVLVVAGAAGLVLGASVLFPGTFSRWQSLTRRGRDAMKIAFGLVPFFLAAALLESFVTRHYHQIPLAVNLGILVASLALILWYFVLYPIRLDRRRKRLDGAPAETGADYNFNLWLRKKLNSGK